ncbi:M56 family metallopeptidase [Thalassoroseus pseudoceratinae]|uniref:M56 family metallopeptidase n=1 Tax=Thalassoroseus pseudoceratinae TaxID=2713176 RepID=UPI0014213025|nr:DUF1559 domain-containing protein [Thalassoroseus pseudoceratinae]
MSVSAGLWCVCQVTLVSTAALLLCLSIRKRGPSLRAEVAFLGLVAIGLVTVFAPLPVPSWASVLNRNPQPETSETSPSNRIENMTETAFTPNDVTNTAVPSQPHVERVSIEAEPVWSAAWDGFVEALQEPRASDLEESSAVIWSWQRYLVTAYLIGLGLGLIRLLVAWGLLWRECRGPVVDDPELNRFVSEWTKPNVAKRIRLIESKRLNSAATTGWRRPVILLPRTWRSWSAVEREAVLAHELSHIVHRDWLTTFVAECVRTLHFYHPLVHWLTARLRMDQELTADANAAGQVGGNEPYLKVLTQMALARSSGRTCWPVRAFLPTRNALMRRVDMLRNNKKLQTNTPPRLRWGLLVGVLVLGVMAIGVRPSNWLQAQSDQSAARNGSAFSSGKSPADPNSNRPQAAKEGSRNEPAETRAFDMSLRPSNAIATFGIRPARILNHPSLGPFVKLLEASNIEKNLGVGLRDTEQVVFYFDLGPDGNQMLGNNTGFGGGEGMMGGMAMGGPGMMDPAGGAPGLQHIGPELAGFYVRSVRPLDQASVVRQLTPNVRSGTYGGQIYLRDNENKTSFWFLDDSSFAASPREDGLHGMITARNQLKKTAEKFFEDFQFADVAGWVDVHRLNQLTPSLGAMNPNVDGLWKKTGTLIVSATMADDLKLALTFAPLASRGGGFGSEESYAEGLGGEGFDATQALSSVADELQENLNALLDVGKNMVNQNRQMVPHLPPGERESIGTMLQLADAVLANAKVVRADNSTLVTLQTEIDANTSKRLISLLVPAVSNAQAAASRTLAKNDLKQILLALHNYHDFHKHFPPPVVIGPDGKTPHSWRVAILPFLDQAELYERYHLDEPWDSKHNQQILKQMPKMFRHPLDDDDSTNTGYVGFVGVETAFGTKDGIDVQAGVPGGGFGFAFGGGASDGGSGIGKPKESATKKIMGVRLRDILDGTSNTIFVVENKSEVPWTKPVDLKYDANKPPQVGGWFDGGFHAGLADGSVRFVSDDISDKTLKLLIERADGQRIPQDFR